MRKARATIRCQHGVVILSLLLIAVSVSSFVILKALNTRAAHQSAQDLETKEALLEAKYALIGYAVAYADGEHVSNKGPGHLPCPDNSVSGKVGSSDEGCSAPNHIGRFPWRLLGLNELVDGSGAPLWYAVSDNHRSSASPPLNSEVAGTLEVAAIDDVVAVIIAPGAPLYGQPRDLDNYYDIESYLEDLNAEIEDDDANQFTEDASGEFNDKVSYITRTELMASVEAVVINEVANALNSYYRDPDGDVSTDDNGYPWLSEFVAPAASAFQSAVGRTEGHLPVSRYQASFDAEGDGLFLEADRDFTLQWSFGSGGTFIELGADAPAEDCVRDHDCTFSYELADDCPGGAPQVHEVQFEGVIAPPFGGNWSQGRCRWSTVVWYSEDDPENTLDELICETSYTDTDSESQIERSFTYALRGVERQIAPADGSDVRREFFSTVPDSATVEVSVSDRRSECGGAWEELGTSTLTLTGAEANAGTFSLSMRLDLEIVEFADNDTRDESKSVVNLATPGALPEWIWSNNWHHLVYVRYPPVEGPGDVLNVNCSDNDTCLQVSMTRPGADLAAAIGGVRGIVVLAGADLDGAGSRTTAADFFEYDNADFDDDFTLRQVTSDFNDKLILLDPEEY